MLKINCAWSDNENKMREDMAATLVIMLEAAGAKRVNSFNANSPPACAFTRWSPRAWAAI